MDLKSPSTHSCLLYYCWSSYQIKAGQKDHQATGKSLTSNLKQPSRPQVHSAVITEWTCFDAYTPTNSFTILQVLWISGIFSDHYSGVPLTKSLVVGLSNILLLYQTIWVTFIKRALKFTPINSHLSVKWWLRQTLPTESHSTQTPVHPPRPSLLDVSSPQPHSQVNFGSGAWSHLNHVVLNQHCTMNQQVSLF